MMKKLLRSKYKEIRRIIIDKEDRDNIIFNKVINNIKVNKNILLNFIISQKN